MPTFNHTTRQQFNTTLRERYRSATHITASNIARYFISRPINEIQTTFAMNSSQATALRVRMNAVITRDNASRNDRGE